MAAMNHVVRSGAVGGAVGGAEGTGNAGDNVIVVLADHDTRRNTRLDNFYCCRRKTEAALGSLAGDSPFWRTKLGK